MRGMCTEEISPLFLIGAVKIAFPPKCRWRTDEQTNICKYRVASLLKIHALTSYLLLYKKEIWGGFLKKDASLSGLGHLFINLDSL